MGLSAMGQQHLTEKQIEGVVNRYADPKRILNVLWTDFLKDIEKGLKLCFIGSKRVKFKIKMNKLSIVFAWMIEE